MLFKDALLKKEQTKWFRSLTSSQIKISNQVYTLTVTDNKRELVYNKNNKLIGTKPYIIDNAKIINN